MICLTKQKFLQVFKLYVYIQILGRGHGGGLGGGKKGDGGVMLMALMMGK